MLEVRTCRVCGCWELQACAGGCAWASADRCDACPPDARRTQPITRQHLEAAQMVEVDRDVRATGQTVVHRMEEFPELTVTIDTERGQRPAMVVRVGDVIVDAGDLDQAARLLNDREAA